MAITYFHPHEKSPKWVWVSCVSPFCGHSRAMPLAPWRIRWGAEDVARHIRRHFKCGSCGRRGCVFHRPKPDWQGANGVTFFDPEYFPAPKQRLRIGHERKWPETTPDAIERCTAEYLARYPCGDAIRTVDCMCNLYSVTKSQQAIRDLVKAIRDLTGNMPSLPAIFPNMKAPVVRTAPDGVRELVMMRWGYPPPSIPGSKPRNPYLTNCRKTDSKFWLPYLRKTEHRCLIPVTSFAEPDNNQGSRSIWTWFAQDETRPLMFFPGIWREFEGDRGTKANPDVGKHLVYSFMTTDASLDVAPIHPDATPVCLFTEDEREMWMNAPWELAQTLQKPPAPGALKVVRVDSKEDGE